MNKETARFNVKPSPTLPRVVTIKQRALGWKVLRGGEDVVTSQFFGTSAEAEEYARSYCSQWGDEYRGQEG